MIALTTCELKILNINVYHTIFDIIFSSIFPSDLEKIVLTDRQPNG